MLSLCCKKGSGNILSLTKGSANFFIYAKSSSEPRRLGNFELDDVMSSQQIELECKRLDQSRYTARKPDFLECTMEIEVGLDKRTSLTSARRSLNLSYPTIAIANVRSTAYSALYNTSNPQNAFSKTSVKGPPKGPSPPLLLIDSATPIDNSHVAMHGVRLMADIAKLLSDVREVREVLL